MFQSNQSLLKVVVLFDKSVLHGRPVYGSISQTDLGDKVQVEFMMDSLDYMARWLLAYGSHIEILEPAELKAMLKELAEELFLHYSTAVVSSSFKE
jgi:predicted DNA-binding transcriptional regulator YafY